MKKADAAKKNKEFLEDIQKKEKGEKEKFEIKKDERNNLKRKKGIQPIERKLER